MTEVPTSFDSDGEESQDDIEQDADNLADDEDSVENLSASAIEELDSVASKMADISESQSDEIDWMSDLNSIEMMDVGGSVSVGETVTSSDSKLTDASENRSQALSEIAGDTSTKATKGKMATRIKFICLALGVVLTVPSVVFGTWEVILRYQTSDPPPDELSDEEIQTIQGQVDRWNSLPDEVFWLDMATYVDTYNPSLPAQLYFMFYTILLASKSNPPPPPWSWTGQEKSRVIDDVEDSYQAKKAVSDFYRTVRTEKATQSGATDSELLPRYIAAEVCSLAISNLQKRLAT